MKKLSIVQIATALSVATLTGCVAIFSGCKSVYVERRAASVALDGNGAVICATNGAPIILDGGWYADYSWHWSWQKFDSLRATAGEGVALEINGYSSGADSNLVALVSASFSGGAQLATAIGDAYIKIAGGGAQAATVTDVAKKVYAAFTMGGGDASKAKVTTDAAAKTLSISDGSTCTTCDASGNCTTGACSE